MNGSRTRLENIILFDGLFVAGEEKSVPSAANVIDPSINDNKRNPAFMRGRCRRMAETQKTTAAIATPKIAPASRSPVVRYKQKG